MRRLVLLFIAALLFGSLHARAYTEISGDLPGSTTWTAGGSPYVLTDSVRLMAYDTLNIEAGVVIKSTNSWSGLIVYGVLNLQGTSDNPVVFTSYMDDSYGGDTNGDGYATFPSAGDWGRLWIRNTWQEITIQHVIFRYGGKPYDFPWGVIYGALTINGSLTTVQNCLFEYNEGGVFVYNCSPLISNCTFEHCSGYSVHIHGYYLDQNKASRPVISDNTFSDVEWPFYQYGNSFPIYSGNIIESSVKYKCILVSGQINAVTAITETLGKFQGTADFPYVLDNYTITVNVTLNLEPGVVIKTRYNNYALKVYGSLNLPGTGQQPVVFTSFQDDSYGGDTNGDGYATSGSPGDYLSGLWLKSDRENTIQNATFRYGGAKKHDGSTYGAVHADSCSPAIQNCRFEDNEVGVGLNESSSRVRDCTFEHNSDYSVYVNSDSDVTSRPVIANNTFTEDEWPIYQRNNSFPVYSGNVIEPSVKHRAVLLSGQVNSDTSKTETLVKFQGTSAIPYVIYQTYNIGINVTLNIEAGVVIKPQSDSGIEVNGVLNVQGASGSPAVFTSFKDDTYGGDTNGDGYETTPSPGDWSSVKINNGSRDSNIQHAAFRYGGNTGKGALSIEEGSPAIENCVFEYNDKGIYNQGAGSPVVNDCDFVENTTAGVENANGGTSLDCSSNFWGDAGGPTVGSNPGGTGAVIVGNVDYSFFLTSPVNLIGRGDLNYDGSIDVSDLVGVINIILERGPAPTEDERTIADINGDGSVNLSDLVMMIDIILGKNTEVMLASGARDILSTIIQGSPSGQDGEKIGLSEVINIEELEPVIALVIELSVDRRLGELNISSGELPAVAIGNRVSGDPLDEDRDIYRFIIFSTSNKELKHLPGGIVFSFDSEAENRLQTGLLPEPVHLEVVDINRVRKDLTEEFLRSRPNSPDKLRESVPKAFSLDQNSPNPFNPSTTISYAIPEHVARAHVNLAIYNTRGQLITTLINMVRTPGAYQVHWDGKDSSGRPAPSGVYLYRLKTETSAFTRKMILLR